MTLRRRLTLWFLVLAVVPFVSVGSFCFLTARHSLIQSIKASLHAIAEFREGEIFLYIDKAQARAGDFASDGFIRDQLEAIGAPGNARASAAETLSRHLVRNKKPLDPSLTAIDVLNAEGVVSASTLPERVGLGLAGEKVFVRGREAPYVSDLTQNSDGVTELAVATPVWSREEPRKRIGVLINRYDAGVLTKLLTGGQVLELGAKSQLRGMGKTGETYLVNQQGMMITESLFTAGAPFRQRVDTFPVKKSLKDRAEVVGVWRNYLGVPVVGASMCLRIVDHDWVLVSEQGAAEALAPAARLWNASAAGVGVAVLLAVLASLFLAEKISRPLRALTREAREIAASQSGSSRREGGAEDDEVQVLAGSFREMTKALLDANEGLKKQDELKSDFVANVSHEFKSPLSIIRESLAQLLEGIAGEINPAQKGLLVMGKNTIDRLARLVRNLLDISRIESGKMAMKKEKMDLASLVEEVLASYAGEFAKKRIRLKKEVSGTPAVVYADRDLMTEAVINLLTNAVKYSPEGGEIRVRMAGSEAGIRFEVADEGEGIPKEYLEKIFDKFQRVAAERVEGTGLGLPITKAIVHLHGGKIWVESEVGKGSVFTFILPGPS